MFANIPVIEFVMSSVNDIVTDGSERSREVVECVGDLRVRQTATYGYL